MSDKQQGESMFLSVSFFVLPFLFGDSVGADSAQQSSAWGFSPESLLWLIVVLCVIVAVLAVYILVKSVMDKRQKNF
jgi:ABC-type branched-subunit amino acid transport system permease subunit